MSRFGPGDAEANRQKPGTPVLPASHGVRAGALSPTSKAGRPGWSLRTSDRPVGFTRRTDGEGNGAGECSSDQSTRTRRQGNRGGAEAQGNRVKEESGSFLKKRRPPPGGNQKTFFIWAEPSHKGRSQTCKSFLLLFFKKEGLA
jgi:hypothetical protein